jgi:hypothetical protein
VQALLNRASRSKQNIERLGESFKVRSCRLQPLFPQHPALGARVVRINAKQGILIFIIAGLAFTKNAAKEASIFLPALHIFQ